MEDLASLLGKVREDPSCLASKIKEGSNQPSKAKLRRGVYWRFFAGLLDPKDAGSWLDSLAKAKRTYTERKEELMKDPSQQEDHDLDTCNPLSIAEDNPYQEFYKITQLIEEIDLDLQRCCINGVPDDFFQQPDILSMMRGVLTVWSTDNPDTSYRQGMHEVLGTVILALLPIQKIEIDESAEGPDNACVREMASAAQIEADCHFVFNYIMKELQTVYRVQTDAERKAQIAKIKAAAKLSAGGGIAASTDGLSMQAPLQAVCETVQNRLILAIDRKLYERLTSFRVVPTIYVMKWARLLFIRDFPIDDIFVIWDFLLWEMHRGASLLRNIENIGAAMVYYNKAYLMNPKCGENDALHRLMRFPEVEDVRTLCRQAKVLSLARAQHADLTNVFTEGFGGTPARSTKRVAKPKPKPQARRTTQQQQSHSASSTPRTVARTSPKSTGRAASSSPTRSSSAAAAAAAAAPKRTVGSVASSTLKKTGSAVKSVGRRIQSAAKNVAAAVNAGNGPSKDAVEQEVAAIRAAWVKFRMQRFYAQHNPAQLSQVDSILKKYAGKHELLFRSLHKKYEVDPDPLEVDYENSLFGSLTRLSQ